eukprot:CAMPEP_0197831744 /NCGR_PEP_ID=MMETSP1437-20131217/11878_1 /TAXON_ID=49252 ORGANISM="Eucampia antarctica, Strain CCMP1452" /NCGR_SAMPLE_ID=MMETSP1437 /ASSEMBLY_ACC=CAM_ASM_001096 /LENGTH=201 /DNA_ID=CAMNT_0043434793 /DNA_START=208 /DNA_END=813 /DNA_ORIENTATION=+
MTGITGINDLAGYNKVANAFVGLNPKVGSGSGFVMKGDNDIKGNTFGNMPESGGPRVDLCTCNCKAGDDGVGCAGWGGVAFKYSSLLWIDPSNGRWTGQIQAFQNVGDGLNFIGTDTRLYPGGPAIYNVACTSQDCSGEFSGVFRQANSEISCSAGIADKDAGAENGCSKRCASIDTYTQWIGYCMADKENTSLGFSGYGR